MMNRLTRIHILTSFVYFVLGSFAGLLLAWEPSRVWAYSFNGQPHFTHVHLQLVGFVIQMIIGIAYHVLPTLSRSSIYSYPVGYIHYALVNAGTVLMTAGFWFGRSGDLRPVGGLLLFAGLMVFVYNIRMSMQPEEMRRPKEGQGCQH